MTASSSAGGAGIGAGPAPIAITSAALSFSSLTIRPASFGPTPCARATMAASPRAQAWRSSSAERTESTASAILAADAHAVFDRLGLGAHLTPQRSNGLRSMVERIKADARAALQAA